MGRNRRCEMDETLRMLGREHEADLEREARKWQRADEVRRTRPASAPAPGVVRARKRMRLVPARVAGFVARVSRVEA
jgi:hypothetical protein